MQPVQYKLLNDAESGVLEVDAQWVITRWLQCPECFCCLESVKTEPGMMSIRHPTSVLSVPCSFNDCAWTAKVMNNEVVKKLGARC